jgi:hypothetical protein
MEGSRSNHWAIEALMVASTARVYFISGNNLKHEIDNGCPVVKTNVDRDRNLVSMKASLSSTLDQLFYDFDAIRCRKTFTTSHKE